LNDEKHPAFQPIIFSSWDYKLTDIKKSDDFLVYIRQKHLAWARAIVRYPTDVVFLTHLIIYFTTSLPSALGLFYNFHYIHGIVHMLLTTWYSGSFTLMIHNHIHNNGILSKPYYVFDWLFPYILEPLMGHTWDSYYYHHVKAHHVEANGPNDLSSTIRY
jgi:hypothetical protein